MPSQESDQPQFDLSIIDGPLDPPAPPPPSSAAAPPQGHVRDRIVILGRRRSGKTIFLARLYEALWNKCVFVDGKLLKPGTEPTGGNVERMSCRAMAGASHMHFMRMIDDMRSGRWPAATAGYHAADIVVEHKGEEFTVTALDYPGEVFHRAFLQDADTPDAVELKATVDRALAAILLIDPAVVAAGGVEAHDDTFGLMQAAARIRAGANGDGVPIAIVFTKADVNKSFLKEAGGVREFAHKHFAQLFSAVERTAVFPCAAVREKRNALGKTIPDVSRSSDNVVEPLRYCLDSVLQSRKSERRREARRVQEAEREADEIAEEVESQHSNVGWIVFAVAVALLMLTVLVVAFAALSK